MKFHCLFKPVPSLPRVRFLGHRLTYTEVSRPHRRTIRIPLLIAPTSHKRPSKKINIYLYIYYVLSVVWPERNVTSRTLTGGEFYSSPDVQSVYSTALNDWIIQSNYNSYYHSGSEWTWE